MHGGGLICHPLVWINCHPELTPTSPVWLVANELFASGGQVSSHVSKVQQLQANDGAFAALTEQGATGVGFNGGVSRFCGFFWCFWGPWNFNNSLGQHVSIFGIFRGLIGIGVIRFLFFFFFQSSIAVSIWNCECFNILWNHTTGNIGWSFGPFFSSSELSFLGSVIPPVKRVGLWVQPTGGISHQQRFSQQPQATKPRLCQGQWFVGEAPNTAVHVNFN